MFEFLIAVQRTIREALSADIAAFSETGNWLALMSRSIVGAGQAPALELASRSLLVAIGAWLIVRALRRRARDLARRDTSKGSLPIKLKRAG